MTENPYLIEELNAAESELATLRVALDGERHANEHLAAAKVRAEAGWRGTFADLESLRAVAEDLATERDRLAAELAELRAGLPEWQCPECGMTTRARMADYQTATDRVLAEVAGERTVQDSRRGGQDYADGTGPDTCLLGHEVGYWQRAVRAAREPRIVASSMEKVETIQPDPVTFCELVAGRTFDVCAESDPARLRAALLRLAAEATGWVEAIDRRTGKEPDRG